jgi:cystathionine gamma-synthase
MDHFSNFCYRNVLRTRSAIYCGYDYCRVQSSIVSFNRNEELKVSKSYLKVKSHRFTSVHARHQSDVASSQQQLPNCNQPLGVPLPCDEHACSVSLPTWSSVVGYEEGDSNIISSLATGYPRFVYHPYTVQLMQAILQLYGSKDRAEDCLVLPTADAAARCQAFLQLALENRRDVIDNALIQSATNSPSNDSARSRIRRVTIPEVSRDNDGIEKEEVHAVIFPAQTTAGTEAKAYWQHTGEVVSSRRAEMALVQLLHEPIKKTVTKGPDAPYIYHSAFPNIITSSSKTSAMPIDHKSTTGSTTSVTSDTPQNELRERIATWAQVPDKDYVFLAPSGMASIYTALRSSRRYQMEERQCISGGTSIVYGFPYLDTLKLCSRSELCPGGVEFFGGGGQRDSDHLQRLLQKTASHKSYAALFTEVPSNPLLQCPDLHRLRSLADEYNFLVIVDDTISNWLNVDVIKTGLADAVCTSLTKLVSGRGDVIAGSIVTNPYTKGGRWMQNDIIQRLDHTHGGLYCQDAKAVVQNSIDFVERNAIINSNAESLADWLFDHNDVETVYYPKHVAPLYETVKRPDGGYGGLLSIILHPHMCQRTFYDALNVAKGPSLGTNFTLVCPYTLLAHYHELDFAMSYNVPPNLLRIAVGLESVDELKDKFENAFRTSRLYPKVCNKQ